MAIGTWFEINDTPQDRPCLTRFAEIMHAMDPRYSALTDSQLASWMDPNQGIYENDPMQFFGWFANGADKTQPTSMLIALACKYDRTRNRAFWAMLGWLAPNFGRGTKEGTGLSSIALDEVLGTVADQLFQWMDSLNPSNPTGGLILLSRPHTMEAPYMAKLHEEAYVMAMASEPIGSYAVSINRERTSIGATYLEIKIAPSP